MSWSEAEHHLWLPNCETGQRGGGVWVAGGGKPLCVCKAMQKNPKTNKK